MAGRKDDAGNAIRRMEIVDWTRVPQGIGGWWRTTREGLILFGK